MEFNYHDLFMFYWLFTILTSQPIYDPFKFDLKWRSKSKIWLKCKSAEELSTMENFEMYAYML